MVFCAFFHDVFVPNLPPFIRRRFWQKAAEYLLRQRSLFKIPRRQKRCRIVGVDLSQKQLENGHLVFTRSYFDESYFTMPVHDSEIVLCNRKISTYVNALAKAGFVIEQMIEQNDKNTMESLDDSDKIRKAKMIPISVCFIARKL